MIENKNTGEIIEFKVQTEELLVMHSTWTRPGQRTLEHIHPEMEERFEVIEGQAAFRINGEEKKAKKGEVVVAPPGISHLAWNPTNEPVQIRIEMRPALRWAEFVTRLCAGENPAALLKEFSREVVLVNQQEANFTPTSG